jgi:spore maturation protein CgeB
MREALRALLRQPELAAHLATHGLRTIRERHTCGHRVDELFAICAEIASERFAAHPTPTERAPTSPLAEAVA